MKVQYTKEEDEKVAFVLKDTDYITANAIRKAVMTYVPSMAVDRVTIYDNTSPLYDEMIAQRVGLIPLSTDLKTYNLKGECKCGGKGCARCEVTFILEKNGPATVYSGDMKAQDSKIKPVYDKIPITKLGHNQKIKMEMAARLGFMGEHAKFQSALAAYKQKDDGDFEFIVESYNNITARDMIELAVENLEKRVEEFEDAFANAKHKRKSADEKKEEELPKEEKIVEDVKASKKAADEKPSKKK
jgi:DNA-directed RNA polymerase subunit D